MVRRDAAIIISAVLLATASLISDKVWIGAAQARRTYSLVCIHHNLMLGSLLHSVEVVVNHILTEVVLAEWLNITHIAALYSGVAVLIHKRVGLLHMALVVANR